MLLCSISRDFKNFIRISTPSPLCSHRLLLLPCLRHFALFPFHAPRFQVSKERSKVDSTSSYNATPFAIVSSNNKSSSSSSSSVHQRDRERRRNPKSCENEVSLRDRTYRRRYAVSVQSVAFGSRIVPAIVTLVNILRSANLRPGEKLLCPTAVLQKTQKFIENLSSSSVFFY